MTAQRRGPALLAGILGVLLGLTAFSGLALDHARRALLERGDVFLTPSGMSFFIAGSLDEAVSLVLRALAGKLSYYVELETVTGGGGPSPGDEPYRLVRAAGIRPFIRSEEGGGPGHGPAVTHYAGRHRLPLVRLDADAVGLVRVTILNGTRNEEDRYAGPQNQDLRALLFSDLRGLDRLLVRPR